jgi:hypothetical protein
MYPISLYREEGIFLATFNHVWRPSTTCLVFAFIVATFGGRQQYTHCERLLLESDVDFAVVLALILPLTWRRVDRVLNIEIIDLGVWKNDPLLQSAPDIQTETASAVVDGTAPFPSDGAVIAPASIPPTSPGAATVAVDAWVAECVIYSHNYCTIAT